MMRYVFLWLARQTAIPIGVLLLGACGGHRPVDPQDVRLDPPPSITTVRAGDVISIEFWRQPELSGERIVDHDGRIHLPLLRGVDVQGLSAEQIREKLTEEYGQFYSDPLIVVNVRLGVNVTGAVRAPGRYTVDPAFSLFDVLGLAGGLSNVANRDEIELVRQGQRFQISLDDALVEMDPGNLRLQSGDWVYVPTRFWTLQRVATYGTLTIIVLQIVTLIAL